VLPLQGDRKPFVFLKTNFDERGARSSPDGHWVHHDLTALATNFCEPRCFKNPVHLATRQDATLTQPEPRRA
jgi:hypothetical protein